MNVALAHDYLTQRGGAERVVLSLTRAFPEAPLFTSLYDPEGTFPEFSAADVRTSALNRVAPLRRHHRLALPLLAPSFSRLRIDADVVVCSSSGWAHGARVDGRQDRLLPHAGPLALPAGPLPARSRGRCRRGRRVRLQAPADSDGTGPAALGRSLPRQLDRRRRADQALYGIEAEVVPPPPALTPEGHSEPVDGRRAGFVLCVSRLLPYKNVDAVVRAFAALPGERLVIAGAGPEEQALRPIAGANVTFVGRVTDARLRGLYAECRRSSPPRTRTSG